MDSLPLVHRPDAPGRQRSYHLYGVRQPSPLLPVGPCLPHSLPRLGRVTMLRLVESQVLGLSSLGVYALVPIGGVEGPRLQDVGHMDVLIPAVELRFPVRVLAVAQHQQDAPDGPAGRDELTP